MEIDTSTMKVKDELAGSEEAIKSVEDVSGCVNKSIKVSGKGKYKSVHS